MDRRTVMTGILSTGLGLGTASLWTPPSALALGLPNDKIKRIRYYKTPTDAAGRPNVHQPTFNQSTNIVTIETDSGLMGIGEGGEPSTMEQCAGLLIGQDPFRIQDAWQMMERGYFYPTGREKTHSLGALDVALWDLKGKALGVPVYELLGGPTREGACVRPREHARADSAAPGARLHGIQDRRSQEASRAVHRDSGRGSICG